eukprot:s4869_g10.t1
MDPQQQQPQPQQQQPNQQERFNLLMHNLGQATEAMARVATRTATQQAQLTAALQSLVEAPGEARSSAGTPGPASVPFDTGGKILKPPEAFSPATIEEEVSQWSDWAFMFKNFLAFMDQAFLVDLKSAEDQKAEISNDVTNAFFGNSQQRMNRGMKLYSVLSSYLKNRPLKVLRSVSGMNGFVWRKLTVELEPSSRSRSLAMAQALVGFPATSKGASLMDYVLTFEKVISEYEKISGTKYDDNLKIGTLLKGIPQNLKQHVMVDITDRTTYDELRTKLLQYERSNQTWSAENILGSLSVPDPTTHSSNKPYQGPTPMELDRIYYKKGKGEKGKGDKGKGGKGKGDKGKGKGYGGRKGGRGSKGKGRGFGRGYGRGFGKGKGGKKGGKNIRQVEGKGYESGKGKGGQGVVCYNCGKTGHIASECWSAPSGKGKAKGGKGKVRNVQETGEEDWNTDAQASSSTQPQARTAPAAKGNE